MAKKDLLRLKPTILVIDDDEGTRDTFEIILKDDYCTFKAEDGKRALEIMGQRKVDLALIDILLPGISGIEILKRIRKKYPGTCCIMLSMVRDPDVVLDCISNGAMDYIDKYLDYVDLKRRIDIVLRLHLREKEFQLQEKELQYKNQEIQELKKQLSHLFAKNRKGKIQRLKNRHNSESSFSRNHCSPYLQNTSLPVLTNSEIHLLQSIEREPLISNKHLAAAMHLSPNTVKTHLRNTLKKLNTDCRRHAANIAREYNLL